MINNDPSEGIITDNNDSARADSQILFLAKYFLKKYSDISGGEKHESFQLQHSLGFIVKS